MPVRGERRRLDRWREGTSTQPLLRPPRVRCSSGVEPSPLGELSLLDERPTSATYELAPGLPPSRRGREWLVGRDRGREVRFQELEGLTWDQAFGA